MAKKDFRQDAEDIFGLTQARPMVRPAVPEKKLEAPKPQKEAPRPAAPRKKPPAEAMRMTLKSYYITPQLYKAMKLRSAMSDKPEDKDLSAIVRAALTAYLKDELEGM